MIRTEGDIILAANLGRELHALVIAYLRDYCTYANGANNIKYEPDELKFITIHGISGTPESPLLKASVCTKRDVISFDTFVEEDPPDDYEGYGRCGRYEVSSYVDKTYNEITIPMSLLLDPKPVRIEKLTKIQKNWIAKQEADKKARQIKLLKDQLAILEA